MRIVELIIDESDEQSGIEAVSLVETPAIEENFIALNKQQILLKEVDKEKRILMGAALVPNKQIYRRNEKTNDEYYIYFSKDTVRKASELFFKRSNHKNATYEHKQPIKGTTIVESWIVESTDQDKSAHYGLNVPEGTWMISMKIDDEELYNKAKEGEIKGFSIEGYFADKYDMTKEESFKDFEKKMLVEELKELLQKQELESYNDYPESATNNAKRARKWREENGTSCGTRVGWTRSSQLANRKPISRDTIARMASFKRHQQNKDVPYSEGCGGLMWDAWGGTSGIEWAINKLKQIDNK